MMVESITGPEKPSILFTMRVEVFVEPAGITREEGLALSPISGPVTIRKTAVVFVTALGVVVPVTTRS